MASEKIRVNSDVGLQKRDELVKLAERYLGYDSLYVWNTNINGIVVQLRTDNSHLEDFWRENWFPASFDRDLRPHGVIYALSSDSEKPSAYYHSGTKTGIVFNAKLYEPIKSLALAIVTDVSLEREEMHFLRGALVDVNGEGVVLTGCTGSGKSTHAFLLLDLERARIHSNDFSYIEHLGGETGRISTKVSERKFYLKSDVAKINPRLKELFKRCKNEDGHVILDPWWIGGKEKFLDTTRIKVMFFLQPDPNDPEVAKRLDQKEALSILLNAKEPFFNPYLIIKSEKEKKLLIEFFQEILQFVACYSLNTAKPVFVVHKRLREIILFREYLETLAESMKIRKEEPLKPLVNLENIKNTIKKLYSQSNVLHPTPKEVRRMAEESATKTKFGNYNFVSTVKNRSAALTVYVGSPKVAQHALNPRQRAILNNLPQTISDVHEYLEKDPLVVVERTMGDNPYFTPYCKLYVSVHRKEMIRLAHMVNQTLLPPKSGSGPELCLVYIPEWHEKDRQILVFPEIGVTYVLGTDYYGEAKKGFLRMAMWFAKQEGMLGLHAGAKMLYARDKKTDEIKRYGMIIFGLTATGKTTHTCHDHNLTGEGEGIEIIQDDVVFLRSDLSALGTEKGFYLKTEGLRPEIQPLIYNAVTKPNAIFENVMVDFLGNVYFGDETLTGNGRGIMQRDDFGKYTSDSINLPPVNALDGIIVAFITRRNTVIPIVSKLTPEQAAAAFMLGESIESSGSDPTRIGESVREVGTNPFIVGDEAEEGNRFYDFIKKYPEKTQFYLLNTGGIGEIRLETGGGTKVVKQKALRVEIPEMATIIREIARGGVEWDKEPYFGTLIPKSVEGVDMKKFYLNRFYTPEQIDYYIKALKREREEYLEQFKDLNLAIKNAFV